MPDMSDPHTISHAYPVDHLEAFQELRSRASGKLGSLPADTVARQVLAVTAGADWPVQRAALEAIIRRFTFARRDGLEVASRPRGQLGLGSYRTRRHRDSARPYQTLLAAVSPVVGSCSCKDFQKGGLGLCKHLIVVLEDLARKPAKWRHATAAGLRQETRLPRLVWDPVRPLRGPGDWLDRVAWNPGPLTSGNGGDVPEMIGRWFTAGEFATWNLAGGAPGDPLTRLRLVEDLQLCLREQESGTTGIAHDPVLHPLVDDELRRLRCELEGEPLAAEVDALLETVKRPLYPYQREGLARFLGSGRLLLADDMGLGKTVQAIAACHVLWRRGEVERGLLVVPAPLKAQWAREWASFSDAPIQVVEGAPSQREQAYREQRRGFLIANYEQVLRDLPLMHSWAPDMMVLDEAQRIKNWATKTAGYVKELQPRYRLVLTGTPMENRLDELASVMDWIDERVLEPKWRLTPWHATLCDGTQEVAGARNLDTLRERLRPVMVRRLRREVLDQLPKRTDTRVPVVLTPAQQAEHDDLNRPIASILSRSKKRPLTQAEFLRLMQLLTTQRIICNGLAQLQFQEMWPALNGMDPRRDALLRSLDSPKLLELRELVRQLVLDGNEKVVVFSQWRRMLRLASWAVADLLEEAGLRSAFFSGDEGQKRRTQNIIEFHDDPTLAVLFSTDAGGVGLNLQRAASSVVNLELPWNPAVLEQRIGRVYRLGQKRPVQVFNLVSEQGIESHIADIVSDKQALFAGLFDGTSNELKFSGSGRFLDAVGQLVEAVPGPDIEEPEEVIDQVVAPGPREETVDEEPAVTPARAASPAEPGRPTATPATAEPRQPPAPPPLQGVQVQQLFAAIRVERTAEGGLRIEAPPEGAATLAAMFQGMADLLAGATSPAASD
jgi:superfamily II DNA or RNA helicase